MARPWKLLWKRPRGIQEPRRGSTISRQFNIYGQMGTGGHSRGHRLVHLRSEGSQVQMLPGALVGEAAVNGDFLLSAPRLSFSDSPSWKAFGSGKRLACES